MEKEIMKFYYPHGLKVVSTKSLNKFFTVLSFEKESYVIEDLWENKMSISYNSPDYLPVLYPLDCLNIHLHVGRGKYICPLEIIMKRIEGYSSVIIDDERWFCESLVRFFSNESPLMLTHDAMKVVYNLLCSFYFDLDNLINRGEAMDVTKFPWNPYESINFCKIGY